MSAFKIVQKLPSLTISSAAGISTSGPIAIKSGYFRIVPTGNAYIEIGSNPVISNQSSIWVAANSELIIKESVRSEPVVGIITGTTTTVIIPEGTGSAFNVGDCVELTGASPSGINTNFAQVASVDDTTNFSGYHNTRLTLNWNTSTQSTPTLTNAELRKVTKIAAYNDSANSNTIHITEVQVVSNFS